MSAVDSLRVFPGRCPLAPENRFFPQEIRQLLYGHGRNAYGILFIISGDAVSILHIRHDVRDVL